MGAYSIDLRERILADSAEGVPSKELSKRYRVSRSWVDWLKRRYRETGKIEPEPVGGYRKPVLESKAVDLRQLVSEHPDWTLKEYRSALNVQVSLATVSNMLRRLGFSVKKNSSSIRTRSS